MMKNRNKMNVFRFLVLVSATTGIMQASQDDGWNKISAATMRGDISGDWQEPSLEDQIEYIIQPYRYTYEIENYPNNRLDLLRKIYNEFIFNFVIDQDLEAFKEQIATFDAELIDAFVTKLLEQQSKLDQEAYNKLSNFIITMQQPLNSEDNA